MEDETQGDLSTEVVKSVDPRLDLGCLLLEDLDPASHVGSFTEEELKTLARDNTQILINEIWKLPTEREDGVVVAELPEITTRLPREKPMPSKRPRTKWQEFAGLKGIQKRKKSRMVWDEAAQAYKPRWGYKRGKDETKDWLVEVPDNADPYKDVFEERKQSKKERVSKNELQRMRNIARGAKTDVQGIGFSAQNKSVEQLAHQITAAKEATASVGKFTRTLKNEKPPKNKGKQHKFEANEISVGAEKSKQMEILRRLDAEKPRLNVQRAVAQRNQEEQMTNRERRKSSTGSKKGRTGSKRHQKLHQRNKKRNTKATKQRKIK